MYTSRKFFSAALIAALTIATIGAGLSVSAQRRPYWGPTANRLTGTYRIDSARSDRVGRAARIATRGLSPEEQTRVREMLSRRLEAPEMLAIERNGRSVTIASSRAPLVTVEADGRDRVEQTPRGRSIRVNATLTGDQLTIASSGDRGNDYRVTFDPLDSRPASSKTSLMFRALLQANCNLMFALSSFQPLFKRP